MMKTPAIATLDEIAPELMASQWFNTDSPITLQQLRGKVVVIEAFQMLCPGCVSHGLPQATRVFETFPGEHLQVLGLHTVFEHHEANSAAALKAFLHEYRIRFPVAIDQPSDASPAPKTMTTYRMRGTPSLLLIDRQGYLRKQHFGSQPDLLLGAEIMSLLSEPAAANQTATAHTPANATAADKAADTAATKTCDAVSGQCS